MALLSIVLLVVFVVIIIVVLMFVVVVVVRAVASPHMQLVIVSRSLPCTIATCTGSFCRETQLSH
jgi:hypothetical protein